MMKRVWVMLVLVAGCVGASAQVVFKTEYFAPSSYRMIEGETDEKVGDCKGSAVVYQVGVNVPLSVKMDGNGRPTMWTVSAGAAYADLNNRNFTAPLVIDEIMNLGLSVNHLRPLSDRWSMLATVGGGIYMPGTRFSRIRFKNILGSAGAVFIYHLRPDMEMGGGLAINNSFGFPMVFPAFYFNWTTEGRIAVNFSMLEGLSIAGGYEVNKHLKLQLVAEMNGQMALLEQDGKDKMFSHQYIVVGFRPEIRVNRFLSIPLTAGFHAMRPAEMTDRKLKSLFQDRGYYFQISPYVSAGVQVGF